MEMSNELIHIEGNNVLAAFTGEQGLEPFVQQARDLVGDFDHELSTATGRKRTASLAAKVARYKTRLDDLGKGLVAEQKKQIKTVDLSRKAMRDALDELKVEARRPLTEWEEAEAKREAEAAEKQRQAEVDTAHELAIYMNRDFDAEQEKVIEQRKAEQQQAEQKAEEERVAREKQIAEEAEKRAIESERQKKARAEEAARIAQERKEANTRHVGAVRKAAKEALMEFVDEETAKKIVLAVAKNQIPNVSINY